MNVEIGTETAQFLYGNICFEFSILYLCSARDHRAKDGVPGTGQVKGAVVQGMFSESRNGWRVSRVRPFSILEKYVCLQRAILVIFFSSTYMKVHLQSKPTVLNTINNFIKDHPAQTDRHTYQAGMNMDPFLLVSSYYTYTPSPPPILWNLRIIGAMNKSFWDSSQLRISTTSRFGNLDDSDGIENPLNYIDRRFFQACVLGAYFHQH